MAVLRSPLVACGASSGALFMVRNMFYSMVLRQNEAGL